ncbi:MAG TPA: hypothetical protein VM689_09560 [Aliidongia sp.]|nr:hypothetical protein [Aliidongia sp.]
MKDFKHMLGALVGVLASASSVQASTSYTPVQFRTVSGIRPFVQVQLNGKPFLFMVHANAGFYMMTTHANAAAAGVTNLVELDNYGISSIGHLSGLGRAKVVLPQLRVAGEKFTDVPLLVFEVPQDPPMQGMLGIGWLRASRVVLDYNRSRLALPESPQDSRKEDQSLIAEGYVAHPMIWDEKNNAYFVHATVDGVAVDMNVSTVAENMLDIEFARSAGIAVGPAIAEYGGPKGSTGEVFIAKKPVSITINGQKTAPGQPHILDSYAYDSEERKPDPDANHLARIGADFMLANQAVIDFGTNTLFIPGEKDVN